MIVTVVENKGSYDLMYGNVEVIGGVQYQVSEEQLNQIKNCDSFQVQSVIRQIVANADRILN